MARPPFRADEVGSLLRPQELKDARVAHTEGRLDDAGLRAIEDRLIREAVEKQMAAGLTAVVQLPAAVADPAHSSDSVGVEFHRCGGVGVAGRVGHSIDGGLLACSL